MNEKEETKRTIWEIKTAGLVMGKAQEDLADYILAVAADLADYVRKTPLTSHTLRMIEQLENLGEAVQWRCEKQRHIVSNDQPLTYRTGWAQPNGYIELQYVVKVDDETINKILEVLG